MQIRARECHEGLPGVKPRATPHREKVPSDSNQFQVKSDGLQKCAGNHKRFVCLGCEIIQWSGLMRSLRTARRTDLWVLLGHSGFARKPTRSKWRYSLQACSRERSSTLLPIASTLCCQALTCLGKVTQHQTSLLASPVALARLRTGGTTLRVFTSYFQGWEMGFLHIPGGSNKGKSFLVPLSPVHLHLLMEYLSDWQKWSSLPFPLLCLPLPLLFFFSSLLSFYPSWLPSSRAHSICIYSHEIST